MLGKHVAGAMALAGLLCACGPALPAGMEIAGDAAPPTPAVPVLEESHFTKDAAGALTEDQLQKVLSTPIDLQFPARVGVVPLAKSFEPGEKVSIAIRSVAARDLAHSLIGSPHFTHVSDISTELPNVGGIEGLRTLAARYRLRYLLLYSERFEDDTHLNGWAWLYPTIIGMFIAPGVTVESHGVAQVDMLDVRTGTILFTVVEPMAVSEHEWMVGAARAHATAQGEEAARAATMLAKKVTAQASALIAFSELGDRHKTRIIPAPIDNGSAGASNSAQVAAETPTPPAQ